MTSGDPAPFYPDMRCHLARLRPGIAPKAGCGCRVCAWAIARQDSTSPSDGPIRPGTQEWSALLTLAGAEQ